MVKKENAIVIFHLSVETLQKIDLILKTKNVVKFNYEPINSECYKNPLEPNNKLLDLRQPLLFQEDKEENKAFMQSWSRKTQSYSRKYLG